MTHDDDAPASISYSLEAGLARTGARLDEAVERAAKDGRVDLAGLPAGAQGLFLSRLVRRAGAPCVVLAPDGESARRIAADLRFFASDVGDEDAPSEVLLYPAADTTPFVDVAPDRRASMDRLSALFHLAQGLPWKFLVVSAPALLRRVPPKAAMRSRSRVVRAEDELDRDELLRVMVEAGYLRVPVVEDPGTFAVRGALIDVYPPHAKAPARIELDDWLVLSIKSFDPEEQRSQKTLREVFIHPVREAILGPEESARARERVWALCDRVNLPSSKARQLVDDLESGRAFLGVDGFLPAFYERLDALYDYLPADVHTVVSDPGRVVQALRDELDQASADHDAKVKEGGPVYPVDAHYLSLEDVEQLLSAGALTVVHSLAMGGAPTEDEAGPLAFLETVQPEQVLHLGAEDQLPLVAELKTQRARTGKSEPLQPLAHRTRAWLEAGLRVLFAARTQTQGERLISLLRSYEVPVAPKPGLFTPETLTTPPPGRAEVVIGALGAGFVLPSEGLACVTEEEIFGSRTHRKANQSKGKKKKTDAFLEDLKELAVGDYVVHVEHGIGKYLGLERKSVPRSKLEELRGTPALVVEVLLVEYAGGDRLFLPVTRLHQIQKFRGGEGAQPKLDRLGGQTFGKTKARVKAAVKQLADELLKLYAERAASARPALPEVDRSYAEFEATFPFDETVDQSRAIEEVLADLEGPRPMDRIVCGDVGFGKTEVALRAAFRVAMAGRQVAVLCPTTVLAQQHYQTFADRMRDYPVNVSVLSRFVDKKEQGETVTRIKEGKVDIVIGTHRLLSKDIHFKRLGLLVVDEEQRFGVTHKERIKKLKTDVDVLTLSATPIPRTLQLAVGGLRDLSLITTPPMDRRAIRTFVTRWDDHLIKEAITREVTRGGQAFFVYNRIEGLYERAASLQKLMPDVRFVVAHGQLGEDTLERVMSDFIEGRYDVLCATAIIESGLDIPRANTILVDRADSFGLSQLYQIRGRVGRSKERAYCYLIAPPPAKLTDEARARLEALQRFTELGSGFHVASLDMELRGAGDLLGAEQSGNVAAVGLDMFVHMLDESVAQMRGEPVVHDVDPELTLDVEQFLPDDYVEDVGLRLSLYKRLATGEDAQEVTDLAAEMEDRFGPPPPPASSLVRAMSLRTELRALKVLGCEANAERITLHLREDTPLDPAQVMKLVAQPRSPWKLTPDMKLTRRTESQDSTDTLERIAQMIAVLMRARKE